MILTPHIPRIPPAVLRAVQVVVAVGLFVLLWNVADGAEAARRLAGANPLWLIAAFATLSLQTVLSALRWRLTAGQLGITLNRGTALREYYLSQIVNQTLPGGFLGDAGRAVRARAQAGLMASGQAVVYERLAGQIAIFLVLAVTFFVTLALPGGLDWPRWLLPGVTVFIIGGLCVPPALYVIARVMPGKAGRGLVGLGMGLKQALAAPAVRWRQLGLSLGTALCNVAAFSFCAYAIGADFPIAAALALVPLILFAMIIPLSVSGWGLREGAAAALFPVAGAAASEGLAASIAFGLVFLVAVLPGVIFFSVRSTPRRAKS